MCFSAEASFSLGSILIAIGLANIVQVVLAQSIPWRHRLSMIPFVIVPVAFGTQQISEGFVWLDHLNNQNAIRCFTFFAYPFWPGFIPSTMAFLELYRPKQVSNLQSNVQDVMVGDLAQHHTHDFITWTKTKATSFRRYIIIILAVIGQLLFAYLLTAIVTNDPIQVSLEDMRIVYMFDFPNLFWNSDRIPALLAAVLYVTVIVGSLLLSSVQHNRKIAMAIAASLFISVKLWFEAFASTWCFFSAGISSMVFLVTRQELKYRQSCLGGKSDPALPQMDNI